MASRREDRINSSKISTSNITSLKRLFENKLWTITNAFKSKPVHPKPDRLKKVPSTDDLFSCEHKENVPHSRLSYPYEKSSSTPVEGVYVQCKIDNCCCKTFFREYKNTPFRPISSNRNVKSNNFNCEFKPTNEEKICATNASQRKCEIRNTALKHISHITYSSNVSVKTNFTHSTRCYKGVTRSASITSYSNDKPKLENKTMKPLRVKQEEVLYANLDELKSNKGSNENSSKVKPKFVKNRNHEDRLNFIKEGKHSSSNLEEYSAKIRTESYFNLKTQSGYKCSEPVDSVMVRDEKIVSANLKSRIPKACIAVARETSHPYVKKPRLTVKGVKLRSHMKNEKRRAGSQESSTSLRKSQTFSGYDNFAYRRSISEAILREEENDSRVRDRQNRLDDLERAIALRREGCNNPQLQLSKNSSTQEMNRGEKIRQHYDDHKDEVQSCEDNPSIDRARIFGSADLKEAEIVKNSIDGPKEFRANNRITSYNWPVNSFYDGKMKGQTDCDGFRLKRYSSLGYLHDENYGYNFRRRRSLDNFNKVSAPCSVRDVPDIANKVAKHKKFNFDIHVHALFSAVEHGYIEKTKTILESSEVDVNSVNGDGLSPLDVAVLSHNKPLVKLLVAYGAQEGRKFFSADDMRSNLTNLLHEAERRVQELGSSLRLNIDSDQCSLSSSSSNIPSITIGDSAQNKTYTIWERRARGLKRMLIGLEQIRPPDPPANVSMEVTSISSIMVYFQETNNKDSTVTTKFRVQWSTDKNFSSLCGHYEVADMRQMKYHIRNLKCGQTYYIRVAAGNIRGYSSYKLPIPSSVIPSSWRNISLKDVRFTNSIRDTLDDIFANVVVSHPYLKNNVEHYGSGEALGNPRRKKTTIKQLFTAASKFQKHLRRGVYLSCLLYHEDKVLVTNEDFLPVIEVDETYPKKIHNDFHWFFKVTFSWGDLKWLKNDMEKSQNSSIVFRIKLLQAAAQMQTALSIQELGKLYHKVVRDAEGTIVISVINYIQSPKSVSVLNLRWMPLAKLTKRTNVVNVAESNVADILMSTISDQIAYHQVSNIKLPRGLYLSYLKMRSSVDSLQVLVPSRAPNILPHCKVRDNPHVTAEEWEWFVNKENVRDDNSTGSYVQKSFVEQIAATVRRLFTYMEVSDEDASNHKLYDAEVIEINKDVSLIMIVPPVETACSMPGQRELLLQRSDLLPLTVQVFETVHFGTYQLDLISLYSRLSCIIEMDMDLAQHSLRKAFSPTEVSSAKSTLSDLEHLHSQLNVAWKHTRWLLDVISFARDRLPLSPTNMRRLLNIRPKRNSHSNETRCYLQPPDPKTAKSRGSWPGIGAGRLGRMPSEMSRSEQHLTSDSIQAAHSINKLLVKLPSPPSSKRRYEPSEHIGEDILSDAVNEQLTSKLGASSGMGGDGSTSDSQHSVSSDEVIIPKEAEIEEEIMEDGVRVPVPSPAVIEVHAAYDTGLDTAIRLQMQVGPSSRARDIVEAFVRKTRATAIARGHQGAAGDANDFCLVAVVGARERCLRDDFKPTQLQRPWKQGRLYVRRKSNVLAAVERDAANTAPPSFRTRESVSDG